MLHDMSREFWQGVSLTLLVGGIVGLVAGWYFGLGVLTWVLFSGGIMGAGYALQLGNWSRSKSEHDGGGSSGL